MNHITSLIIVFSLLLSSCAGSSQWKNAPADLTLVHYNIKEFDSQKLIKGEGQQQVKSVINILKRFNFNLLSINEIQYDLPGVPRPDFTSRGQNMNRLATLLGLRENSDLWSESFWPANTGMIARPNPQGEYTTDPSEGRRFADPYNFGLFPAQYSTGSLAAFKKVKELIITDLPWKVFNPNRDLSPYAGGDNTPLPEDMPLFDKNFSDITLDVYGKEVHLILLHAVPAFHFGDKKSPNYVRNQDQLRFLEWYVTGKTDIEVNLPELTALKATTPFIIVGDLNSDYRNQANPGSEVIRRLMKNIGVWMARPSATNESPNFQDDRLTLTLDYIFFSDELELIQGGIYRPAENKQLISCVGRPPKDIKIPQDSELVYFQKDNRPCYGTVSKDFYQAKIASDHFPIWASFNLK